MEHLGGKKERRSQKDKRRSEKLKGKRPQKATKPKEPKNPHGKTRKDPEADKRRKEKHKRDVAEGRAGLAGAGRAGRQPTKKQKEKSRKVKHKKRLYAAVAKVASENPEFRKALLAEIKTAQLQFDWKEIESYKYGRADVAKTPEGFLVVFFVGQGRGMYNSWSLLESYPKGKLLAQSRKKFRRWENAQKDAENYVLRKGSWRNRTASVDAVRGTAFNVARMLKGKVKEIPIDRIPDLRNYRHAKFVLDPAASVAYLVKGIDAYWSEEIYPTNDPQDAFTEESEGTYSVLFYPVVTKSGGHPGMEFLLSEEGKLPWQGSGLDVDHRIRRWQDREIAKWIGESFERDQETDWEYERDKYDAMQEDAWEARREERYASGMRTAPLRTVVPPSFDSNQWRYFKGPAKTLARAWREKKDPPWHLVDRTIKKFEEYQYLREQPGWEDNEQTVSIMDALDKLRDYRDKLYPQGKPKKKRKMSPGKILADMMTDPAIVAMVRKLTPFFKRKPAEAAMFASEVLEDANFHSDNRLFNVAMADYDRDTVPLSYSDVAMKLRWDGRVLPFAAALLIAAGAKGAARSMLKKWGDNNKSWLLQNA